MTDPVRSRLAVAVVLAIALVAVFASPTTTPGWPSPVLDAQAAQPGKTPPAKGKPTPRPTPRPTPNPTPVPKPQPTPTPTPKPTAPPRTVNPTPRPAPRQTPTPASTKTATPKPAIGPVVAASGVPPIGGGGPSASTRDFEAGRSEGSPAALLLGAVALAATGAGFVAFALARRRRRPAEAEAVDASNVVPFPPPDPVADLLSDPLLEAMASNTRTRSGGKTSTAATGEGGAAVTPTWVQRLDADINRLADSRDAPSPPPHRSDARRRSRHAHSAGDLDAAGGSGG